MSSILSTSTGRRSPEVEETGLRLGEDFTRAGHQCLAKALLEALSPDGEGLTLYTEYFKPYTLVGAGLNFDSLSSRVSLTPRVRALLYRRRKPQEEPKFFSFFSHHDVNRLAQALNKCIVIYRICPQTRRLQGFHDFRATTPALESRQVACFAFDEKRRLYMVSAVEADYLARKFAPCYALNSEYVFSPRTDSNLLLSVARLLGESRDSVGLPLVRRPWEVADVERQLWALWKKPLLFVAFSRLLIRPRSKVPNRRHAPKAYLFTVLGFCGPVADPSRVEDYKGLEDCPVVCFSPAGTICVLAWPYAQMVKAQLKSTQGLGERLSNAALGTFSSLPEPERKARLQERREKRSARSKRLDALSKKCGCSICSGEAFDLNMSKAGPERLVTVKYTATELLKMLGMWDGEETQNLIAKVCELSVASMDIESRTVKADLGTPRPGPGVPYSEVDTSSLEGHVKCIQRPVMIAHLDGLMADAGEGAKFLSVRDDTEEAVRILMRQYLSLVLRLQLNSAKIKRALLEPLLQKVGEYKKAYFEFCHSWELQDRLATEQERCLLEERLRREGRKRKKKRAVSFTTGSRAKVTAARQLSASVKSLAPPERPLPASHDDSSSSSSEQEADEDEILLLAAGLEALRREVPQCLLKSRGELQDSSVADSGGDAPLPRGKKKKVQSYEYLYARAWTQTLPGQLEGALDRLVREYNVFSFYG